MKKVIIIVTVYLSLFNHHVFAQAGEREVSMFNNLYMGFEYGGTKGYQDFIQGGIWVQLDHNYFKLKVADATDRATEDQKQAYQDNCNSYIKTRGVSDLSLIYGKSYVFFKRCQIQFGSGLSLVTKTDKNEEFNSTKKEWQAERYKERYTIGLPAELKTSFHFNRAFSISCSAHVNANPIKSFRGVSAGLAMALF